MALHAKLRKMADSQDETFGEARRDLHAKIRRVFIAL
jgi:hypothetical protein